MAKVPFTSAGAATKIQELYALSDAALLTQANLIRSAFRAWINDNFILDASQQAYLAGLDSLFVAYISQQLGMGVQHRLPVTLTAPPAATAPAPELRASKLISCHLDLFRVRYDPLAGTTATGSVSFEVAYQ